MALFFKGFLVSAGVFTGIIVVGLLVIVAIVWMEERQ